MIEDVFRYDRFIVSITKVSEHKSWTACCFWFENRAPLMMKIFNKTDPAKYN